MMSEPAHPELADPEQWHDVAADLLRGLGFTLIQSDSPGSPGGSNLLVALRERPTLRHFDPEAIRYWTAAGGRGCLETLDRHRTFPIDCLASWGSVRIVDRLRESNRFLTFGGPLHARAVNPELTVVALNSPAPIVRWSGHSQAVDPLAEPIGAFFARLMVRVDFVPGAEARLAEVPPVVLYAAFIVQTSGILTAERLHGDTDPWLTCWIATEHARLVKSVPDALDRAAALLKNLDLSRPRAA
jgi:hypothetical protein